MIGTVHRLVAAFTNKLRHFPMRSHDKGLGIDLAYLAISGDGDLALKTGKRCMSISWNKQFRENGSMYRDTLIFKKFINSELKFCFDKTDLEKSDLNLRKVDFYGMLLKIGIVYIDLSSGLAEETK